MNNEEKNIPEVESVPEIKTDSQPEKVVNKKLPPSLIGIIIGGFVMLILAIVLLVTIDPGKNPPVGGGNTPTEKGDYTVTVVDENGTPVPGVKLSFTTPDGIPFPGQTGTDGKATLDHDEDGVKVKVVSIPQGYEYAALNTELSFNDKRELTVTVSALAPIEITIVDDEGNPLEGVLVQICDTAGSCRIPTTTDAQGKAYYPHEDGEFHAQLTGGAPDGYSEENPGAYYDIVDGKVTIVLTKNK